MVVSNHAPKYGEHTHHILHDILGFSPHEIHEMTVSGAVSSGWCNKYIPGGDPWYVISLSLSLSCVCVTLQHL
jgi:hypothetical protein